MKVSEEKVDLAHLAAILLDVCAWKPGLRPELERDFIRVLTLVESRGWPIVMISFPHAGKVLDLSLSRGRIFPEMLPTLFGRVSGQSRALFRVLFREIFNDDCTVKDEDDVTRAVFFLRQLLYMYKKVVKPCSQEHVEAAIEEFIQIESRMAAPSNQWGSNKVYWLQSISFLDGYRFQSDMVDFRSFIPRGLVDLFQQVCDRVVGAYPLLDYRELQPRHGTGAVADAETGTDKYQFPYWPDKLEEFFPITYFGQSREDMHLDEIERNNLTDEEYLARLNDPLATNHELPSKLIAVPKTLDKPRIIASEPIAHQYCQQALMRWLRDNLPAVVRPYIHFHDQTVSQKLALEASSGKIDCSTVDLSSASDRLSCWVVERAFRRNRNLLDALHASRTRWLKLKLPKSDSTQWLYLKKYAPQGNATTFPVQSLVYFCAALASVLFEDGRKPTTKNMLRYKGQLQVFGDDIILPSRATRSLTLLLTHIGLKVNMGKTHVSGPFRESCGMDAFRGSDVSPCYLRHTTYGNATDRLDSFVDVSNNAYEKGLWNLSDYLFSQLPEKVRKKIVVTNVAELRQQQGGTRSKERDLRSGLTLTTFQESPNYPKAKWNHSLQHWEVPGLRVTGKTVQGERTSHRNLLQYFVEDPSPDKNWHAGFLKRTSSRLAKIRVQVKGPKAK